MTFDKIFKGQTGKHVLVIENEEPTRWAIMFTLEFAGYDVTTASN